MRDWFGRFAAWAQRKIASPYHLMAFLIVSVIWLGWAVQVRFSDFSQLVLNTPTTWAEYVFEILVLAAALRAANSSSAVLDELRQGIEQLTRIEQHVEAMVEALDAQRAERNTESP